MSEVSGRISGASSVSGGTVVHIPIGGVIGVGVKNIRELRFLPFSEFPDTGTENILYVDITNDVIYYWHDGMYHSVGGAANNKVFAATTSEWNNTPQQSIRGGIYIYTDYRQEDGVDIPAIKIGDGSAYVVDLPFFDTGVTEADREFWNNKVSASISAFDQENLILHTD